MLLLCLEHCEKSLDKRKICCFTQQQKTRVSGIVLIGMVTNNSNPNISGNVKDEESVYCDMLNITEILEDQFRQQVLSRMKRNTSKIKINIDL